MIGSMLRKAQLSGGCDATASPDAPYDLTSSGVTSSSITLNWEDATSTPNEASSYEVGISSDNTNWTSTTINAPASLYTFSGLSSGTTHYFRIRGINCAGASYYDGEGFTQATSAGTLSPSWTLDFSSGTPSGYTLTRASSGTYVDSSGYIASAATNVARLTHDSSGSRLGLLVEESRTQRARNTSNWDATLSNVSATRTANYATAPNNQTEATRVELTSTGYIYKSAEGAVPAGDYTLSVWIKATSSGQSIGIRTVAGGSGSITTVTTSTTWTRYSYQRTLASSGGLEIGVDQRSSGIGGPGTSCDILIWGAQIENGADLTSYIPYTGTSGSTTRSADLAHVLDSNITSWGDPGALVVHFYPPGKAGTILSTDDASTAQVGIEASSTTAARAFWSSGSTSTGTIGTGVQKAVHYWNGSTSKFCINGGTVQSGTNNLTIGNTDFVTLGAEATDSSNVPGTFSQYANCVIRKVEFYSGTLTDANLQTITT